jgi:hypothetical protein
MTLEHVRPQPDAAQGPGVRSDPFDQCGIVLDPCCGARQSVAKPAPPISDDLVRAPQHAQTKHLVDGRIGDHGAEFADHQLFAQLCVAGDRPADANAGHAVTLRKRARHNNARAHGRSARRNRIVAKDCAPIGFVDQQERIRTAVGHRRKDFAQHRARQRDA